MLDELDPTFPKTFFLTVTRFTTPFGFINELLTYHRERTEARDNASLFQVVCVIRYWLTNYFHHLALKDRMATLPRLRQALDTAVSTAHSSTPPLGADIAECRELFDKAAVDIATPRATGVERALQLSRAADADVTVRWRPVHAFVVWVCGALTPTLLVRACGDLRLQHYQHVTNMWDVAIKDLAEQWTLLEFCMFQAIPLVEFMDKAWGEPRCVWYRYPSLLSLVCMPTHLTWCVRACVRQI